MNKVRNSPITVEQTFNTSIGKLWQAITDENLMRQWFFEDMEEFKPEVGFKTEFNVQSGGSNFLHQWKITEVIPGKKITYNWKYKGHPGNSHVTFELSGSNEQSKLKLSHVGQETFPKDVPEFTRESCQAGWEFFIQKRLKTFLE